jgi:nucleoside 2-deoxyribosyltransferase
MKLYLAGPMRGVTNGNAEAFKDARNRLRDMRHEIFCPSEFTDRLREAGESTDIRKTLAYDFAYILHEAEGIVMLPGWRGSKGTLAELHIAWAIGIPAYEYEFFVRRVIREVKNVAENSSR